MIDWVALWLTTRLAACTSLILILIGLPLAYWLGTTRWRGRPFVEAIVALPLVLPPTVLGFYVLVALGPKTFFGQCYQSLTGHLLTFTFQGLLVGSVLYSLPFAVQPFIGAFRSLEPELFDAAKTYGATPWQTFLLIAIPLAWPGITTGVVLSFAHTLGEFGVVLMVGGNIPGVTRTVSITIYDQVQSMNYAAAGMTSLLLLLISFAMLSVVYLVQHRIFRVS